MTSPEARWVRVRRAGLSCFCALLAACPPSKDVEVSVSDVKRALAERDAKLPSYRLAVTTEQGGARAEHELFYRAPNLSRGDVSAPERVSVAFDGRRFYRLRHDVKRLEVYEVKLSPPRAAYFLASTFTPFVPEGYRAPLLPTSGLSVKRVAHPKAAFAVELSATVEGIPHAWVFRWPAVDVLEKRVGDTRLTVETERCEKGLCVPTRIEQRTKSGVVEASTTVTRVELGAALPNDGFQLTAPEGYTTEPHSLVDDGAAPAK